MSARAGIVAVTLALIMAPTVRVSSQIQGDSLLALLPYEANLQGIALDVSQDTLYFYVGFDLVTNGSVNVYRVDSSVSGVTLQLLRDFVLPPALKHPNTMVISGDTLLVTGWDNSRISTIGYLRKTNGEIFKILRDSLFDDYHLQFCLFVNDTLVMGLTNGYTALVQKRLGEGAFSEATKLNNKYNYYGVNFIQGATVFAGRFLAIITSGPPRLDFYQISHDYKYITSIFLESNGAETQGLAALGSRLFFGMKGGTLGVNRIKSISVMPEFLDSIFQQITFQELPTGELHQNFPNPFNVSTNLRFIVYVPSVVRLQIFNLLGQRVDEVVRGELPAGDYNIKWDARGASGVYLYRIEAIPISASKDRFVGVGKMILIK